MSRAYRIEVSETLSRHIEVEDGLQLGLELLELLPPEAMNELLAASLLRRGYSRQGQTCQRRDDQGVQITVDLHARTVTVGVEAEVQLELSQRQSKQVFKPQEGATREDLARRLRRGLEAEASARTQALQVQVTERLERCLRDLKPQLDAVGTEVTKQALTARARQLGEVEEISEGADGSMTIRVRV